jgi:hypothetical protein
MRNFIIVIFITTLVFLSNNASAKQTTQEKLDEACENARTVALAPLRKVAYKECMAKGNKSEAVCKKEASDYNGNRVNRTPMFYELPECVKAFEYKKSQSR